MLGAAALALSATVASAATVTIMVHDASGDGSNPANPNQAHLYAPEYGAYTPGDATWAPNGVTVIAPPPGSVSSVRRSPWDATPLQDVNSYFVVGPAAATLPNPAVLTYDRDRSSIRFLWGSVDSYNSLTFGGLASGAANVVVTGTQVRDAINSWSMAGLERNLCRTGTGNNFACTALLTFTMTDDRFRTVSFLSEGSQAFEFAMPIPLPAPALLLLTGIGALGGMAAARRRRETNA